MSELTKVINFFGGPGVGKSTTAAETFAILKHANINCELVREFVKDMVWEGRPVENQLYIFAKQYKRMQDLKGKVDVIVTDSPLLLSKVYAVDECSEFFDLVDCKFNSFDNLNILLNRNKPFHQPGRLQNEEEAKELDRVIRETLTGEHNTFVSNSWQQTWARVEKFLGLSSKE